MWMYDLETLKFLAVNQAAIDHYGYSHEVLSMTMADIPSPEDIPTLQECIATSDYDRNSEFYTLLGTRKTLLCIRAASIQAYSDSVNHTVCEI
jgi:hypothetical protein